MELILNRIKYECTFDDVNIIVSSDSNELAYNFQWKHFLPNFEDDRKLINWAKENKIDEEAYI